MARAKKSRQPPAPQPPHIAAGSSAELPPQPRPRTRRGPNRPPSSSGEEFHFSDPNGPSSGDEEDEQPASRPSPSLASVEPAAGSAAPTRPASPSHSVAPATLEPPAPGPHRTNSTTAWDIQHFFKRGSRVKETRTVCKLCRYLLSFDVVTTYSQRHLF